MCVHKECKTDEEKRSKLVFIGFQTDDIIHELLELYNCPTPGCKDTTCIKGIGPTLEE